MLGLPAFFVSFPCHRPHCPSPLLNMFCFICISSVFTRFKGAKDSEQEAWAELWTLMTTTLAPLPQCQHICSFISIHLSKRRGWKQTPEYKVQSILKKKAGAELWTLTTTILDEIPSQLKLRLLQECLHSGWYCPPRNVWLNNPEPPQVVHLDIWNCIFITWKTYHI